MLASVAGFLIGRLELGFLFKATPAAQQRKNRSCTRELGLCPLCQLFASGAVFADPGLSDPSSVKFGSNPSPTGLSWGLGDKHHPPTAATDMGSCASSAMTFPSRILQFLSLS